MTHNLITRIAVVTGAVLAAATSTLATASNDALMSPVAQHTPQYNKQILDGNYRTGITKPAQVLGHPVGYHKIAEPDDIATLFNTWAKQSDQLKLVQYATSHEGRPLYVAYISSANNLARLDEFKANIDQLANPTDDTNIAELIDNTPATAHMAYSIHGNETSGADAAVAAAYHLIADQSPQTKSLLDNMIVMIDPMMNPDGRARFAKTLEQYRGVAPNVDDQSLLHSGEWPFGRMNHYFFDLNRDFFYLTQPESRGRVALINDWYPQLMIDAHEMGSQDTFLMGPPREPLNKNVPAKVREWGKVFAQDQAAAFDQRGWRYYTGEWFENLFTGYSNYAEYRGSVHILYEQSRMAEDGVARPEGTVQTYAESVHHQYVSTMANLQTLAKNSKAIYRDFVDARRDAMSDDGQYADKTYVLLPTKNNSRLAHFIEKLQAQDIDVYVATDEISLSDVTLQTGEAVDDYDIPKGSVVIPNRQAEARLIAAILEFDAKINDEVLRKERSAMLRGDDSLMYDTTAWNLTMMYGLEALVAEEHIDDDIAPYSDIAPPTVDVSEGIAWVVDGADDNSLAFAARLMEQGVEVRASNIESQFGEHAFSKGSIMVTVTDNPGKALGDKIKQTATELGLGVTPINTGFGKDDLPEWGGSHFVLLERPRIAMLSQTPTNPYAVGSTWFAIDSALGIPMSQIDIKRAAYADLRRYNTIIVPPAWGGGLQANTIDALKTFMQQGGTVISLGGASASFARQDFVDTAVLSEDLASVEPYDMAVYQELMAAHHSYDLSDAKLHTLPTSIDAPWGRALKHGSVKDLAKRDQWLSRFMPRGSFVTGRVNDKHWLGFGTISDMPLLYTNTTMLMPSGSAEAVIRAGKYKAKKGPLSKAMLGEWLPIGWTSVPKDADVQLRMSGLLWPEASQRILNTGYLVRESVGNGQLIMFANEANYRGAALGSRRMLLNALVLGPGMGTNLRVPL